jgi:hypothetical protein
MGDEPYTKQQTTSSRSSARSTSPHQAAYAAERAKVLFGSYRRGDANDPDSYVAAIAAVLSGYETDVIREVTDPRTGICTTEKYMSFMPNAGELKVYCEGLAARRERFRRLGELPPADYRRARLPPPPPVPGDQATIFVPASNSRYASLLNWSKTADPRKFKFEERPGIWVSYDTWDNQMVAVPKIGDIARQIAEEIEAEQPAREAAA